MPARALPSRILVVLVTCPKRTVAERIARTLVSEGHAACVNVVPGLMSTYRWQGKICRDPEVLLIIKTRRPLLQTLTDRVRAIHPYAVPEVIALPLVGGSPAYLSWVEESTREPVGPDAPSGKEASPRRRAVRKDPPPGRPQGERGLETAHGRTSTRKGKGPSLIQPHENLDKQGDRG
jgi:periplasmic divalent cation tolerance protein